MVRPGTAKRRKPAGAQVMANDELLGYDPASLQRWTGTEMGTLGTRSLSKLKVAMCYNISL